MSEGHKRIQMRGFDPWRKENNCFGSEVELKAVWTLGNLIEDNCDTVVRIFEGDWIVNIVKKASVENWKTTIYLDLAFILKRSTNLSIDYSVVRFFLKFYW